MPDEAWHRWDAHAGVLRDAIGLHVRRTPSPAAFAKARLIVLDTVGCALAGRRVRVVQALEAGLAAIVRYAGAGVAAARCTAFAAAVRGAPGELPMRRLWRLLDADAHVDAGAS